MCIRDSVCAFAIAIVLTRGIKGTNIFRTVYFMPNLIGGIPVSYTHLDVYKRQCVPLAS